ncbi:MAG TPA: glycosyltransferase [Puia sp.]|nr:glycosyltransferase [Puia sp.]
MTSGHKYILIASTCVIDWGGSEELWARSIPFLLEKGFKVVVYKAIINRNHPQFAKLAARGVIMEDRSSSFSLVKKTYDRFRRGWNKLTARSNRFFIDHKEEAFVETLSKYRPALAIISQGINFDGLHHASQCLSAGIPYAIISQKAVDFFWPGADQRKWMIPALLGSQRNFFVSAHNQRLTEEQFGTRLANSKIIYNPVKVRQRLPFPTTADGYRLACVARIWLIDKGQDILVRILSDPKWRQRAVTVSFIGEGEDLQALQDMVRLLTVTNVRFCGQQEDMERVWMEHHALILPSRSEGLPLSLVEAMAAGRPAIVSNAGGNPELVRESVTGFIGDAAADSFSAAMERAWLRRSEWEAMGREAAACIETTVPVLPESDFANEILSLIHDR